VSNDPEHSDNLSRTQFQVLNISVLELPRELTLKNVLAYLTHLLCMPSF